CSAHLHRADGALPRLAHGLAHEGGLGNDPDGRRIQMRTDPERLRRPDLLALRPLRNAEVRRLTGGGNPQPAVGRQLLPSGAKSLDLAYEVLARLRPDLEAHVRGATADPLDSEVPAHLLDQ